MADMKQSDLKPCSACGKGVMHEGIPIFYTFSMSTMGVDANAVQQQVGLEMMLGGSASLANVMGTDAVMAAEVDTKNIVLCHSCMMNCNVSTFIGGD